MKKFVYILFTIVFFPFFTILHLALKIVVKIMLGIVDCIFELIN